MKTFNEKLVEAFELNSLGDLLDSEKVTKFEKLAKLLVDTNKITNLTAITDDDGIILKHFVDCASVVRLIPKDAKVIDVGCGGGFPSLPIAILRDDISVKSLDSTGKKIDFVKYAIDELGLIKSSAVCARAEEFVLGERESCDCCVSRAVARLNVLSELCLPFVKVGGLFVAMKADKGREELDEARSGISKLGGDIKNVAKCKLDYNNDSISRELIVISKGKATPNQYPRKYSQILKKPL